jgi:hypothetical protein
MQSADGATGVINPTQIEATTHRKEGKNAPATKNATASNGPPPAPHGSKKPHAQHRRLLRNNINANAATE